MDETPQENNNREVANATQDVMSDKPFDEEFNL